MKQEVAELQQELTRWLSIRQEEMLADIAELVEIPSVCDEGEGGYPYGRHCAQALLKMGQLADRYGFEWKNHDWHAVSIRYGKGPQQLGIWGHLDVVPAGDGWIYEPFQCNQKANFLIGRGTQDNKGPDIGSLYILRYLKEHGIQPPFEIRLIYGCQEETGMHDVEEYLTREAPPDLSFVPDCGFPVCYGEKGVLELELTSAPLEGNLQELFAGQAANAIPGKACAIFAGEHIEAEGVPGHSAYPDGCVNAIGLLGKQCLTRKWLTETQEAAFRFLAKAGQDGYGKALGLARSDDPSGAMTCSPTMLCLREGRMQVLFNIRYPITVKAEDIIKDFKRISEQYGLSLRVCSDNKPNHQDPHSPWLQYLTDVYTDVMGERQEPYAMSGGTYARKVPNAAGFGPGLPKDMSVLSLPKGHGECHQPDESQCIDTLLQAWKIYTTTVLRLIETGLPIENA